MLRLEKEGFTKIVEQPIEETNAETFVPLQDNSKPRMLEKPERQSNNDGLFEMPYEEDGQKYVNLKVKVLYGDKSLRNAPGRVLVTGIMKDKYTKNGWVTRHVNQVEK